MTCEEFDAIVAEVARGAADPLMRDGAIGHAAGCEVCEGRLEEERRVSEALRALAADTRDQQASFEVEAQLLQAFRAQKRHSTPAPVVAGRSWSGLAAAAAVTLVAGSASLWMMFRPVAPQAEVAAPVVAVAPPAASAPAVAATEVITRPRAASNRRTTPNLPEPPRTTLNFPEPLGPDLGTVESVEIVTDFLPVLNGSEPIDAGHLIRVELPRSALQTFGMSPVEEPSTGTVQADVLFGADGVARQIRFVSRNRGREAAQPAGSILKPAGSPLNPEGGRR